MMCMRRHAEHRAGARQGRGVDLRGVGARAAVVGPHRRARGEALLHPRRRGVVDRERLVPSCAAPVGLDDHRVARLLRRRGTSATRRPRSCTRRRARSCSAARRTPRRRSGRRRPPAALVARVAVRPAVERASGPGAAPRAHVQIGVAVAGQRDLHGPRRAGLERPEHGPVARRDVDLLDRAHRRARLRRIGCVRLGFRRGPARVLLHVASGRAGASRPGCSRRGSRLRCPAPCPASRSPRGSRGSAAPATRWSARRARACSTRTRRRSSRRRAARARGAPPASEVAVQLLEHALEVVAREPRVPRRQLERWARPGSASWHRCEHLGDHLPGSRAPRRDRGHELVVARREPEVRGVLRGAADDLAVLHGRRARAPCRADSAAVLSPWAEVHAVHPTVSEPDDRAAHHSTSLPALRARASLATAYSLFESLSRTRK